MKVDAVIFCLSPGIKLRIEEMYEAEARAAEAAGLKVLLMDHDAAIAGRFDAAVRRIPFAKSPTQVLYRGWMMPIERYAGFELALRDHGYTLITSAKDYQACHQLPGWYASVEELTARSRWIAHPPPFETSEVKGLLAGWAGPVIVKDYVKTEKLAWKDACFIPDSSDFESASRVINRFIEQRGDGFEGGLALRQFLALRRTGVHPQSGMPLAEEIRTFWEGTRLVASSDYWGDAALTELPAIVVEAARRVNRPFYTIDAARLADGGWVVMEVGDGQVSALPDAMRAEEFYGELAKEQ